MTSRLVILAIVRVEVRLERMLAIRCVCCDFHGSYWREICSFEVMFKDKRDLSQSRPWRWVVRGSRMKIVPTRREGGIYTEKIAGGYGKCTGEKKDGKLIRDVETRISTKTMH